MRSATLALCRRVRRWSTPAVTTTYTATAGVDANNSIQQSAAVTVTAASTGAIKHIFFMLQENRSFDNYFGQLASLSCRSPAAVWNH